MKTKKATWRSSVTDPHCVKGFEYAEDVVSGKIDACQYVKKACQRHLDDWDSEYFFDEGAAGRACRFIEKLPHTKGKWAAQKERLKFQGWQCFIITAVFGWMKPSGLRKYREVYLEVPRKNGKSIFGAGVGNYCAFADGEFGAEVYSGATTEKQAWEVFRPAKLMLQRTPKLRQVLGADVNASNISRLSDGSRFEPLIGSPGDGASPHCAIVDEYHEHRTDDLYDTMLTGMGAREQPLMFVITTAGGNIGGPCYEKRRHVIEVLEGRIDDPEQFGVIYTVDQDDDWTDVASLKKANPNFGVSVFEDYLISRQRQAMQSAARQNGFKTKHLNQWVGAKSAFINMLEWQKCPTAKFLEELKDRRCFVGLDLASKIDIAAMLLVFPPEGDDPLWHVHPRFWLPEDMVENGETTNSSHYKVWAKQGFIELTPGNVIDFDIIEEEIRDLPSHHQIEEIGYDPWQATQMANSLVAEGVPMVEVNQTVKNFSEPMKQVEALIRKKHLAHPHNPVLDWMVSNVTAQEDKKENVYPNKDAAAAKIDGFVAMLIAVNRIVAEEETQESYTATHGVVTV